MNKEQVLNALNVIYSAALNANMPAAGHENVKKAVEFLVSHLGLLQKESKEHKDEVVTN
jgi:hypothetical protein